MGEPVRIEERASTGFGETYAPLRIVSPRWEAAMEKSLRVHGQLTPVVCARSQSGDELIDGFKRVRALRRLGREMVVVRVLEATPRACKAAMIQLNKATKSLTGIEEGFIVKSLRGEDGLSQGEIGVLLGRHQSWVSRRLSLVDRLDAEVQENVRLGLVSVAAAREIARMPRGIQKELTAKIVKYRLTTRQVGKLVGYLLSRPRWEHEAILAQPWELFENPPARSDLRGRISAMHRICRGVVHALEAADANETAAAHDLMDSAIRSATLAVTALQRSLEGPRE
jgi:ParB-like chromosome segregation protein Spo0J